MVWETKSFESVSKVDKMPRNIVFDLDGTLICSLEKSKKIDDGLVYFPIGGKGTGIEAMNVTVRPGAFKIIEDAKLLFDRVVVFTAGTAPYAHLITQALFGDFCKDPRFKIYSREVCVEQKFNDCDILMKVFRAVDSELDSESTYVLDDRFDVHMANHHIRVTKNVDNVQEFTGYQDQNLNPSIAKLSIWAKSMC